LQDLRQPLLRRQADFDNYRKRIEKERAEDSKRYTARVVEALIRSSMVSSSVSRAPRSAYENYRKGFELITSNSWTILPSSAWSALSRSASVSIRTCTSRGPHRN